MGSLTFFEDLEGIVIYRRQTKVISVLPIGTPVPESSVLSIYCHKWVKNASLLFFSGPVRPKSGWDIARMFFGRGFLHF